MPSTTSVFAIMNRPVVVAFAGLGVAALGLPVAKPAVAASVVTLTVSPAAKAAAEAYWTPERFANAKPMVMISKGNLGAAKRTGTVKPSAPVPGGAPTVSYDPAAAVDLFTPKTAAPGSGVTPDLIGTGGFPFTVNRLYPVRDTFRAYPYALVGQLFFAIPGQGEFVCTASVIRKRVIATAGHCTSDGSGHFYTNWVFVPALHGGFAPYGAWTPSLVATTNNWFFGGGGVPNIQDDALLVLNDQFVQSASGQAGHQRIGDIVGFFGFQYNAPLPTHITQLGYPCNLDSCSDPIANYAQVLNIDTNNFEWGSAEMGGASGGPEVQDFGVAPAGTPPEIFGGNVAVSVLSFGFVDASILVDGGSIFGAPGQFPGGTFGDLIKEVCTGPGTSGNC